MNDLNWCRAMLPKVSRTFALGIQMLPAPFEEWLTVGYLLCRVVDTVEDTQGIDWATRRRLFNAFDEALITGDTAAFETQHHAFDDTADGELSRGLARIVGPMQAFPEPVQNAMKTWIGEMSGGMAVYARRHAAGSGRTTLHDLADLERYCYFVAGTVGHLLTDVFLAGTPEAQPHAQRLRKHAMGFGLLLQMTNIVKDVTDDWPRGWCFIPATVLAKAGTTTDRLLDPAGMDESLAAVNQVNAHAQRFFADAVAYVLAIPPSAEALRRFCLLPMLLAGKTLALVRNNPAVVDVAKRVKVSREIVMQTAAQVEALLNDDQAIGALTIAGPAGSK
ncbi:MAG: squalene/phytoene synthase family protein [Myxococcota bacterium]|nr:squalene/phytoene synthase family protein [Myxococcota bacterium]